MSPISLEDLTPEQLQRLQARMAELRGGAAAAQGIPRRSGAGPAPLSFAQRQIWLQHQVDPGTLFNVPLALRLTGELDPALIRRVLDEIVRRHELLRTTFQLCDEGPVQVVGPAGAGARFAVADLSGAADPAAEALRLARVEADTPFDLAVDPPFRTLLLRLGPREHVLCTTLHHVAQDRWSSGLLMGELAALYRAFAAGVPSPLPEPRIQYADFAVWQLERLGGEALDPLLAFWKEHLEGAPPSPSPAPDHLRGSLPLRPVQLPVHIPPGDVEALRRVAREESGTLFTVLLAAYLVFLRGWTGEDDLVVGTYVANRTRTETERLVGSLANTLALRFRPGEGGSFRDLLRQVRATVLAAQGHQELPFERLVEELQPVREPGRTPLIRTAFNVPRAAPAVLELPGVQGEILPVVGGGAGVDLHWALEDWDDGVVGALEYDAGLYLPDTAERMAAAYLRLLDAVSADPDAPLDALDLLGPDERARVLHAWNGTRQESPAGECVHHLFAAAAARTPDAVAVDSAAGPLTYAELDLRSADLARRLGARGVGPDVRVGLCLERSPELMVALLAVLRAGGAYVPLDPAYPAGRLAFMLRDSAARVLLTREGLAGRFGDFGGVVVFADGAGALDAPAPEPGVLPENLAYVIYTSGSTGTPKGVAMTHRALVNLLRWQAGGVEAPGGRGHAPVHHRRLRRVVPGDLLLLALGGTAGAAGGGGAARPGGGAGAAGEREGGAALPPLRGAAAPGGAGGGAGRRPVGAAGGADGGGAAAGDGGDPAVAGGDGGGAEQPVRALGDARGDGARAGGSAGGVAAAAADRAAGGERALLRAGCAGGAGAGGGAGGAVPGGSVPGAGVPGSAGADGGEVRAGRALRGGGGAGVPDRGPGAVAGDGGAGVPGESGPAGEGARLPHRARGGGDGAGAAPGCAGGGGRGAGGQAGGVRRGRSRDGGGAARARG
ncbi:MAG TPA: condensation domain-containing protein [Longimicrobiaceae bacterium]